MTTGRQWATAAVPSLVVGLVVGLVIILMRIGVAGNGEECWRLATYESRLACKTAFLNAQQAEADRQQKLYQERRQHELEMAPQQDLGLAFVGQRSGGDQRDESELRAGE